MAENYNELYLEIQDIKEEINNISAKVDKAIDLLTDFTIMLTEVDESEDSDMYEDTWVPSEEDFWQNDEDDEI